jgi:serine/threonine protein kinase
MLFQFGDFEVLQEIGRGGMGVVYLARQVSLDRHIALKCIRASALGHEATVRRFETEAMAAAKLQHPHIVAIHEIGEHAGEHWLSMDYVRGPSLAALLRGQPQSPPRAAVWIGKIANAIHHAHQRGVLHRDLKPSNILIDDAGEPQVTDFGLAKLVDTDSEVTRTGTILGSPHYMAPEQASGRMHQVDARTDVYALGATLKLWDLPTRRARWLQNGVRALAGYTDGGRFLLVSTQENSVTWLDVANGQPVRTLPVEGRLLSVLGQGERSATTGSDFLRKSVSCLGLGRDFARTADVLSSAAWHRPHGPRGSRRAIRGVDREGERRHRR